MANLATGGRGHVFEPNPPSQYHRVGFAGEIGPFWTIISLYLGAVVLGWHDFDGKEARHRRGEPPLQTPGIGGPEGHKEVPTADVPQAHLAGGV
jgi:hypothetical protein